MSGSSFTWSLEQIADAAGGKLLGKNITVQGLSTDTRKIEKGNIFIALVGPNFDGHDYAAQAQASGALAIVVNRSLDVDCPQIIVDDTLTGLGRIAKAWRTQFNIPLIAVTGSNGKTTVKEMITSVMSVEHKVLATQGNLNNEIGVPLTLLGLNTEHTCAVIEMGANHPGEIAYLTELARPTVAVITNAGPAHLEGFGSLEGVAMAKGEIFSSLNQHGVAIINADDQFASLWVGLCQSCKASSFGLSNKADISATWEICDSGSELEIKLHKSSFKLVLPLLGKHNVLNALAAIAASEAAGASQAAITAGLEKLKPVTGRLQMKPGKSGSRIIDDTYNANPASLMAALDVLSTYPGEHFLALGDMGELGQSSDNLHREAGVQARVTGVHKLFTVGKLAKYAAQSFGEHARSFSDQPSMISAISDELTSDVTLLVKGSRLMQMEKVVSALTINNGGNA